MSTLPNYITNYFSIINDITNYLRQQQITQEKLNVDINLMNL